MKQYLFTIVCSLLIMATFTTCSKDATTANTAYVIPQEALTYLQVPQNKIFAYKDSATGVIDSVVVNNFSINIAYQPPYTVWTGSPLFGYEKAMPGYEYQQVKFELIRLRDSSLFMVVFSDDPYYPDGPSASANGIVDITGFIYKGDLSWSRGIFSYPSNTKISNLIVENRSYSDVVMCANNWEGDPFYWAKGVGLIKFSVRPYFTYTLCN